MPTLRQTQTYSVEQCRQMVNKYTQEYQDAIAEYARGDSWYDGRTVAREALRSWHYHLRDALARQEIRRDKYDNGISGNYHD